MFRKIIEIFKKDNLLNQAYELSYKMLEMDFDMFKASVNCLRRNEGCDIQFDIYKYDRKINEYQREVRKKVVTHLSVLSTDISPGLVLISIVIDIERIGDYTKNIYELAVNYPKRLNAYNYEPRITKVEKKLTENFEDLINCYKNCIIDKSKQIMEENAEINSQCDNMLDELILTDNENIKVGDGVALTLYIRYLKRVSAHLQNIASSIVNPFHNIGFKAEEIEEKYKDK